MRSEKKNNKRKKKKRIGEIILSIAILLAIFIGGVAGYYGSQLTSFLDGISDSSNGQDPESIEITQQLEDVEPFAALILGTDVEDGGTSRSDTIIVVTVNPEEESTKIISIPRDTIVTMPDGTTEKINAAFARGGPLLARSMVGNYLDIPIEFYATMDFRGLVELVDAVGGVTVDSDLEFTENNYMDRGNPIQIEEGVQTLNGAEALGYARMRKQDPRGDFGRQERQQEVIIEVLDELASFETVTNLNSILSAIQPYLRTNATGQQMLAIAGNYSNAIQDIEQLSLDGEARNEYFPHYGFEVYVWEAYDESLEEIQTELKNHLKLDENGNSQTEFDEETQEVKPSTSLQ